ncbi:hypothetical protein FB45DRAFT_900170 [Roridomyces roridus]|uniref:Uncharacterized protein n=1 Tax=Roridomyces roridus TaxID=1738132 RepID=A0AAD7FW73_9AGAR|nr:hypothetical protein FB45DRAFT_900170 [Roridomyces roridus]
MTSIFSSTRVGSPPPTPYSAHGARFSTSSKRYRESTHLIPTPGTDKNRPKRYDPVYFWLPVVVGTPLMMLMLGIALEIGIEISSKNGGFAVPVQNVFSIVSTQFLLSFFPTLFVIPVGYVWRSLDWMVRMYQPYVVMVRGNATAEESVLLDYIALGPGRSVFRALKYNHRVVFWSSLLAVTTYIYQPLAGSIFQVQTRGRTSDSQAQSIQSLGLSPDVAELNAFAAAAGYAQAAVFNRLGDPPFVNTANTNTGWTTAQFVFSSDTYLNGSMTVNTTGIRTNSNCSNPISPTAVNIGNGTNGTITATSLSGCNQTVPFNPQVATQQYGVASAPCPQTASSNVTLDPVVFWFYQQKDDQSTEAKAVFCQPFMELFYIKASADLASGQLTGVSIVGDYVKDNNITGPPLNNDTLNGVIFENNTNPFIEARATGIKIGVPGAIFRNASQQINGLQSVFDLPNGFLDLTRKVYTMHLAVAARSAYFVNENTTLSATETQEVPRLYIDPFPAHILAFFLFFSGFLGVFLQLINRRQRRNLFLAAPPGTLAAAVSLTSRSGFGDLLLPYDNPEVMEKKLDALRFRLDKRTGAVLADDYEPTVEDTSFRGPDDAMMSLLGHAQHPAAQSSSEIAKESALEVAHHPLYNEPLRTPYDK